MRLFHCEEIRARRRERWLLLLSVGIGLVASGCMDFDLGSDWDSGSDVDTRGCQMGTRGELDRVLFKFRQNGVDNLSASEGRAFAAGTTTRFSLAPLGDDELPAVSVASTDAEVFTVFTADNPEEPHGLSFLQAGQASLRVLRDDDGSLYDEVALRVAEPAGIILVADHLDSEPLNLEQQFESPDRVVLAPWSGCRLYLHLVDQSGHALFGLYTEQVAPTSLVDYREGDAIAYDVFFDLTGMARELEALAEGTGTLSITGPRDATGLVELEVTATPDLERLVLSVGSPVGEYLEPGSRAKAVAVGITPQGHPAFGYDMAWESDNPAVAVVVPGTGSPDTAFLDVYAPGRATIVARWWEDQSVQGSVEITVEDGS